MQEGREERARYREKRESYVGRKKRGGEGIREGEREGGW